MWTCIKCQQPVDDQLTVCPHCGAPRSAGRFSKGIQPGQTPMAQYTPDYSHIRAGRGFMAFGALLTLLIPAVVLLLAIVTRKNWTGQIYQLMHPEALDDTKASIIYWICAAAGMLLATLPGLGMVGLGKTLRRLGRIEDRL